MKYLPVLFLLCCFQFSNAQNNVGIGTNTPNAKSILEVQSTTKGVLFPRMNTTQRNAITNPPDGLHIFNTDDHCLNYYDSTYQIWNCYCTDCQAVIINITADTCKLNFYEAYAKGSPAKKYVINIAQGVTISGCLPGDTALSFSAMLFNADITINNRGTIAGAGGAGGDGSLDQGCSTFPYGALPGKAGGSAVATKAGVKVTINNYGIVAGGGGGGGGSGGNSGGYGGGGGGGAGIVVGPGGLGGGLFSTSTGPFGGICQPSRQAVAGSPGTATTGGNGGAGASGGVGASSGATGGRGGNRAQQGANGSGSNTSLALGGIAGKVVTGGSGNTLTNLSGGQSFGVVD